MSAAVIENVIHREQSPADIVSIKLDEAHICGDVECRTISNSDDVCPGCCGKTCTLANIVENPINSLAHEIADDESKIVIWSFSTFEMIDGVRWYNIDCEMGEDERGIIDRSMKYLTAVGSLILHPNDSALVRWE